MGRHRDGARRVLRYPPAVIRLFTGVVVALLGGAAAQPDLRIPRASAVTIDGRLEDAEWAGSARERSRGGLEIRLQHDGTSLFIGVTSPGSGFVSVCLANGDAIRVLHASAALGSVNYQRNDSGDFVPAEISFAYGMRNTALDAQAAGERRAYLAQHGWVASTARMGGGRVQEVQVALKSVTATTRLAISYYLTSGAGSVMYWPDSMSSTDGCDDLQLVRGYVPTRLRFDPSRWAALKLGS